MRRALVLLGSVTVACSPTAPKPPTPSAVVRLERPLPYPVPETPAFKAAVERGTRTRSGRPGPNYWQQWSEYRIEAELNPATKRLTGTQTIRYFNRSPDTLRTVFLFINTNLFAPDAPRNDRTPITGPTEISRVSAGGQQLNAVAVDTQPGYAIDGTRMRIRLPVPLMPGAAIDLGMSWAYTVPPDGAPRTGTDGQIFFIAYWYPQMAVYDDVSPGWQIDPYMGTSEFYMGYGDYDVSLTVPEGWLIGATGLLQNAGTVLSAQTQARLDSVRESQVTRVVRAEDRGAGRATARGTNGKLTWRFQAKNVRDFAFGTSDQYLWDATDAPVSQVSGGHNRSAVSRVHTFYRPTATTWDKSAEYGRYSIEFLSRWLWPYAYPQMTSVDGVVSCSGMEYPMITCIGGRRDTLSLFSVTVHEYGHMWFPMQVGSDERRYAWMDEGLTRFNQSQGMFEFFRGYDRWAQSRSNYLNLVRLGETELMRHGDLYPSTTPAYAWASYDKMSILLVALREILGDSAFLGAYREYGRRWVEKHPTPYDLWNTFNELSGRDLSWFWRVWFYDTWALDQAVAAVQTTGDSTEIVIQDVGMAPMPVRLAVTREDGSVQRVTLPVEPWLAGSRRQTVRVSGRVQKVEIDPEQRFPDVDRSNNMWIR